MELTTLVGVIACGVVMVLVVLCAGLLIAVWRLTTVIGSANDSVHDANEQMMGTMLGLMEKEYSTLKPDAHRRVPQWDRPIQPPDLGRPVDGSLIGSPSFTQEFDETME